jgi:hypothetical protein
MSRREANSYLLTVVLWAGAAAIAVFLAMLFRDSAVFGGIYVPQGNDSFYHARRVLDALGGTGFYETDVRLHAPDGRLVPWPWAYDYLLSVFGRIALWFAPGADPLAVLFYVPVAFAVINAALFLAAATALRLSMEMRAVAMLCFALSPLTQLLHGFGMLDHHFVEHTFVLLQVWLGLKWFSEPANPRWSAALGLALGIAPGFHTGLFVLQVAPMACLFVLWLRNSEPPRSALRAFAIALVVGAALVTFPSVGLRSGYYEVGVLSWFHLHVAMSAAVATLFIAWRRYSLGSLAGLATLAAGLAAPMARQVVSGVDFISGDVSILSEVFEARSVYAQVTRTPGLLLTASLYSWLLLLAPALLLWFLYSVATVRQAQKLFYAIAAALGLVLLLSQFRFHYYGFFALVTGGLAIVDGLRNRFSWHRGAMLAAALVLALVAYQPALHSRLFQVPPPGLDPEYGSSQALYLRLAAECADEPGVVLANANDGNPILFHSNCSVITNNFILSGADDEHLRRAGRLYWMQPEEIRQAAPEVRYVLVRTSDFSPVVNGRPQLLTNNPVVAKLLLANEPPQGYTLLQTVYFQSGVRGPENVYARLYKIDAAGSGSNGR